MVVLSKLTTDFYKSLGFKNRTTGINFTKYVLQATANNYKTEEDFKKFLKPKISNLSSLGIDINDKKSSNTFKILKDIKKSESKKGKKKQEEIEKKIKDLENSLKKHMSKPQTWHISGTIKIKEKYSGAPSTVLADERLRRWSVAVGLSCAAPEDPTWSSYNEQRHAVLDCFFTKSRGGDQTVVSAATAFPSPDPRHHPGMIIRG